MYTGHMIDELMELVAQAESHVQRLSVSAPQRPERDDVYIPRFFYEPAQQPALVGVA